MKKLMTSLTLLCVMTTTTHAQIPEPAHCIASYASVHNAVFEVYNSWGLGGVVCNGIRDNIEALYDEYEEWGGYDLDFETTIAEAADENNQAFVLLDTASIPVLTLVVSLDVAWDLITVQGDYLAAHTLMEAILAECERIEIEYLTPALELANEADESYNDAKDILEALIDEEEE